MRTGAKVETTTARRKDLKSGSGFQAWDRILHLENRLLEANPMDDVDLKGYLESLRRDLVEQRAKEMAFQEAEFTRLRESMGSMNVRMVALETRVTDLLKKGVVTSDTCALRERNVVGTIQETKAEIVATKEGLAKAVEGVHHRVGTLEGRFWSLLVTVLVGIALAILGLFLNHVDSPQAAQAPATAPKGP